MEEGWLVGRHRDEKFRCSFRFLGTSRASSSSLTFYQHSALVSTWMLGIPLDSMYACSNELSIVIVWKKSGLWCYNQLESYFLRSRVPCSYTWNRTWIEREKYHLIGLPADCSNPVLSKLSLGAYGASLSPSTLHSFDVPAIAIIYVYHIRNEHLFTPDSLTIFYYLKTKSMTTRGRVIISSK